MSELSLRRRGGGLPTSAADELRREQRRTRWLRIGLAAAALALLLGAFGLSRELHALPTSYFATGSGGIVVLDLSTSVDAQKSQRVQRVLQSMAETEGRVGLIVFSDSAYEMLPPDTRSEELRPLLRFFDQGPVGLPQRFGARRGGSAAPPQRPSEESPWSLTFRGGTRISTGLAEARAVVAREGNPDLSVLLLSDLDDSGFDTSALTEELVAYERDGIRLRVVPLFPAPEDRRLFTQIAGKQRARRSPRAPEQHDRARAAHARGLLAGGTRVRRGRAARAPGPERALVRPTRMGEDRVSERPWLRPAAGAVAVAALVLAAAVLVALAADVLRWDRQIRDGDIAYGTGAAASWEPNTLLPRGVSSSLLGVEDDLAYRHAVDRFWRSKPRDPIRVFEDVTRRSAAERVLGQAFTNDGNRTRRSQLAVLRAALMFEEGRNSPTQRQVFVRRAIEQLERAVILDPSNDTAVYDLELALKLLRASGSGVAGSGDTRSPLPSPGAGSATSGSGF